MALSSIDLSKVKQQIRSLKATNAISVSTEQPECDTPIDIRSKTLTSHTDQHLDIDFATISAALNLELNRKIRPLTLQAIIQKRLEEMGKQGTLETIPQLVWELLKGLRVMGTDWPCRKNISADIKRKQGGYIIRCALPEECKELIAYRPFTNLLLAVSEWHVEGSEIHVSGGFATDMQPHVFQRIISNELSYRTQAGGICSQ